MVHASTKLELYESVEMVHPNGTTMCRIDRKRANWYIQRNLGAWLVENESLKLNFVPSGEGKSLLPYYVQRIESQCVVCGSRDSLSKHHIVPYLFRQKFPLQYKSRNHHDILPLCVPCHERYELMADKFKEELATEYGFSPVINKELNAKRVLRLKIDGANRTLALARSGAFNNEQGVCAIPAERLHALEALANTKVDMEDIDIKDPLHVWADAIVATLNTESAMFEFVKRWRSHFVQTMAPQFLNPHWKIDHPLEVADIRD